MNHRAQLSMMVVLTYAAYKMSVGSKLPAISYLTLIDLYVLASGAYICAVAIYCRCAHRASGAGLTDKTGAPLFHLLLTARLSRGCDRVVNWVAAAWTPASLARMDLFVTLLAAVMYVFLHVYFIKMAADVRKAGMCARGRPNLTQIFLRFP